MQLYIVTAMIVLGLPVLIGLAATHAEPVCRCRRERAVVLVRSGADARYNRNRVVYRRVDHPRCPKHGRQSCHSTSRSSGHPVTSRSSGPYSSPDFTRYRR